MGFGDECYRRAGADMAFRENARLKEGPSGTIVEFTC